MSNWPLAGGQTIDLGTVTPARSGTAHVPGAWAEVTAATPASGAALIVSAERYDTATGLFLLDVAIGAAGSERLLGTFPLRVQQYRPSQVNVTLPLEIPAGSRISARVQSTHTSGTPALTFIAFGLVLAGPLWPAGYQWSLAVGVDRATTSLVGVTHTYAVDGWQEMLDSTPHRVRAYCLLYDGVVGANYDEASVRLGFGASGSEQRIGAAVRVGSFGTTDRDVGPMVAGPFPVDVPAGERLALTIAGNSSPYVHQVGLLLFG